MEDRITIITKERKKMQIDPLDGCEDGQCHIAVCNLMTGEILFSLQPGDVLEHHKPRFFPSRDEYFYPSPHRPFVILQDKGLEDLIGMKLTASEQAVFFGLCAYIPYGEEFCMTPDHTWCDMRQISKVCALSERTVKSCIGSLEKKGLILINRDMKSYRYKVSDGQAASDVWFKTNMAAMGQNGKNWLQRKSLHKKFVIADASFLEWIAGRALKAEQWRVLMACMRRLDFNRCTVGHGNGTMVGEEELCDLSQTGRRTVRETLRMMEEMEIVHLEEGRITFNPFCVLKGVRVLLKTYEIFRDTLHCKRYNEWTDRQTEGVDMNIRQG